MGGYSLERIPINSREKMEQSYQAHYQKQRLSYEDTLARKLREQEDKIVKKYQEELIMKDKSIQSLVDESIQSMTKDHETQIQNLDERYQQEYKDKYEAEALKKASEMKSEYQKELQHHVTKLQVLSEQANVLQEKLSKSREYEDGSMKAHRISAAALAFSSKLETSSSANEEYQILKDMTSDSDIITSALTQVSDDKLSKGIPTVSDLQSMFEYILPKTRQAIFVPSGTTTLRGQWIGYICSKLLSTPIEKETTAMFWNLPLKLSSLITASSNLQMDVHLSKAYQYLQIGDLEQAVYELDEIGSNCIVALTIRDWKNHAKDRILIDRALNVIKIECSLLNQQLIG